MDGQQPETRLKVLENSVSKLDERVTAHGREIDALTEALVRTQERDTYRDKQMASVETKVDRIDGKLDLMAAKPAEKWDKATWVVVSVVITAVVTAILSRINL